MGHGRHRFGIGSRLGLLALACLVLLVVAVPVMAAPGESGSAQGEGEPNVSRESMTQGSGMPPAGPASIEAAYEEARRKEEERERELEEQPFVAERESSRNSYAEDSRSEAEELFRSTFGETLASLNAEPGRLLSDSKLDRNLGHGSAVITSEGKTEILEADQPIEAAEGEGEMGKVDLSLEKSHEGFEPENPIVETVIGESAEEGVELGDEGLTIRQVGAEESEGHLFGGKNVFFGEIEEGSDTDQIVSPTSDGVEFFDMLRSVHSPDTLRFKVEIPPGDTLRKDSGGGAEVVNGEKEIVTLIPPPHGEDAQGTYVPVELGVEGDSIVLTTKHREEDLAYPVLIDPDIIQNWGNWLFQQNLQGTGYWSFETDESQGHYAYWGEGSWPTWNGLFINVEAGDLYEGNRAVFYLNSRNHNVWIGDVRLDPFQVNKGECSAYAEPYDYAGYWDPYEKRWSPEPSFNEAENLGYSEHPGDWSYQYDWGLGQNVNFNSGCWRSLAVAGVSFHMGEWVAPSMVSASASAPAGWFNGKTEVAIHVDATDEGLGVKEFAFSPNTEYENPGNPNSKAVGCAGTFESPCPLEYQNTFSFSGNEFPQGENHLLVTARSPTEQRAPTPVPVAFDVDREPPTVELEGQLMTAVEEAQHGETGEKQGQGGPELNQPVYNLIVNAKDGVDKTTKAAEKRSGVKTVEVTVTNEDGEVESSKKFPNTEAPCAAGNCAETETFAYPINMTGLAAGKHHVIVKAWDFAGNEPVPVEREFEYFPATGLTEEDVTQRFLLHDGKEHGEGSYQGPELGVNVMDGDVVYHQRDVEVEGPDANLEVELFYNSLLPKEESSEIGLGWTLAQTPSLDPAPSGKEASALTGESELTGGVTLPQKAGEGEYSDKLGAYIEKEPGGDYAVSEDGKEEPATVYDSEGQATEVQTSPTAAVEYGYEGEHLSEIAVDDPGTTDVPPPPVEKAPPTTVAEYFDSFGSKNGGGGNQLWELADPTGVAVDSSGDRWVADSANDRVEEFLPSRETSFREAGTNEPGKLHGPTSLAFDAAGDLWVTDTRNGRIGEFSSTGTFIKDVGTEGTGTGQFKQPQGIAVAPDGHIYVTDTGNDRIVELNAAGEWIKVVGPSGPSEIEPTGIGVGPEGEVWVADRSHDRVIELSQEGEVIRRVGSAGSGPGQFSGPSGIAVGASGEVWVGDAGNDRVEEFSKGGVFAGEFGSPGTGSGQFSHFYESAMGVALDGEGNIFVTDSNDDRVEDWQIPHSVVKPIYLTGVGKTGSEPGEFRHPAGLAVDNHDDVWVPDLGNDRIQEFNRNGEFIKQIGESGFGDGQFNNPKSIAFTEAEDFWVADSGSSRLEEFNQKGEFIKAVGSRGEGNGQFNGPEAVAVAPDGNIWVADTYNYRVVELDEEGKFIRVVPIALSHIEPTGIAFEPDGDAWIADWADNRVVEVDPQGEVIHQIATTGDGTGEAEFSHPDTLTVDEQGILYVVDQMNDRVELFGPDGEYISQFGSAGSNAGQFHFGYPTGIAVDRRGDIWVADSENNRIEKWQASWWVPVEEEVIPQNDDPSVDVTTNAGLITSITGAEAGSHHYAHSGELMTADEGPEGTTLYEYEPTNQLKKIKLPDGTTAMVEYDEYGRAKKVTVDQAGAAESTWTKFEYVQEISKTAAENHEIPLGSREVIVEPQHEARTFYAIDGAGDVVKSWNVEAGPVIFTEGGNLTQLRNEKEIEKNDTQELEVQGFAPEGVKSIQIIVNGSTIVDEKTCTGSAKECEHFPPTPMRWIVEPEELPVGTMWIEVLITGRVTEKEGKPIENKSSTRWWVTVPYIPPPEPGIPQPPKYKSVLEFREEYGLDLDLNPVTDERELQDRVWETIDAWWTPETEAGKVANATWELWGVPLRYVDEQELDYRQRYMEHDIPLIEQWGRTHFPGTFAGVYVDQRAGGIMRVGFTSGAAGSLAQLKSEVSLMAPERLGEFQGPPVQPLSSLEGADEKLKDVGESLASGVIVSAGTDVVDNGLVVGTEDPAAATEVVRALIGPNVPLITKHEEEPQELAAWQRNEGQIMAGDYIAEETDNPDLINQCSAGFGAYQNSAQGKRYFLLTAAHCGEIGKTVYRGPQTHPIGKVIASDRASGETGLVADAAAVQVGEAARAPVNINVGSRGFGQVTEVGLIPEAGEADLCHAGSRIEAGVCGKITSPTLNEVRGAGGPGRREIEVCFQAYAEEGDSGGPVWIEGTHAAVGLVVAGRDRIAPEKFGETCAVPLRTRYGVPPKAAVLANGGLGSLKVRVNE
jgi:DNA-binding beta-propeller fold protein YncE